jgi:hypothetical protein
LNELLQAIENPADPKEDQAEHSFLNQSLAPTKVSGIPPESMVEAKPLESLEEAESLVEDAVSS